MPKWVYTVYLQSLWVWRSCSLSLFISRCYCLSIFLCLCVSLSTVMCFCLSIPLSLSVSLSRSVSVCASRSLSLSISVCVSLWLVSYSPQYDDTHTRNTHFLHTHKASLRGHSLPSPYAKAQIHPPWYPQTISCAQLCGILTKAHIAFETLNNSLFFHEASPWEVCGHGVFQKPPTASAD